MQKVSIWCHTSIFCFSGNVLCANLLYCWYDPRLLYPLQPAHQWLPMGPNNNYQVVASPYLPLEWRNIIFCLNLLLFQFLNLAIFPSSIVWIFVQMNSMTDSSERYLVVLFENGKDILGACLGTQQVSIHHNTSIFVSQEMPFILLFCANVYVPARSFFFTQYIGGYQWVKRTFIRWWGIHICWIEWRKIVFCVILLIFILL